MWALVDHHGRSFPYRRPPLTEACNYRCAYHLPDGYQADGRPEFLAADEICRRMREFAAKAFPRLASPGASQVRARTCRRSLLLCPLYREFAGLR